MKTLTGAGSERAGEQRQPMGFTLIELLVVISVIGIIAAMVLGLGSLASRKKHDAVASATISKLTLMIENYQSKLGFYPPDNANNAAAAGSSTYDTYTAQNQLLYELVGASQYVNNGAIYFQWLNGASIPGSAFQSAFGRGGVANSNPDERHSFYYPLPKSTDYNLIPGTQSGGNPLYGFTVPLPGPTNSSLPNFVHYDSSSPARHNSGRFDLWVEYDGGSSGTNIITITNGNW